MAHKSRFAGLIIDCQVDDMDAAAAFWTAALGRTLRPSPTDEAHGYRVLDTRPDEPHMELQRVAHPSRVHLDIETDDVEAEVRRLEALGAKRVKQVRSFWVMEAPTGQRFCVVKVCSRDFEQRANIWRE